MPTEGKIQQIHLFIQAAKFSNFRARYNVNERKIDKAYFENNGFHEPVFFPNGKRPPGLEVGDDSMNLDKVVQIIGGDFRVRWVLKYIEFDLLILQFLNSYTDTTTLREYKTTLARFKKYYDGKTENAERFLENPNLNKRYNVISLEFSKTNLVKYIKPPLALRESSWTNLWPSEENG